MKRQIKKLSTIEFQKDVMNKINYKKFVKKTLLERRKQKNINKS